jgi:hypothetical protein
VASGNIPPPYRELAHRVTDGLEVILSWQKLTDELTITVFDERGGAYFELVAAPDEASTGWGDDPMSGHAELCDVEGK